jgi:prepilin-type N-terminal cleavage/methylation domain-containing protein
MRRQQHAFTLVELLVVIGIIAVLISVLLPALNRARQSANVIDCQARLRQMGQALQIYSTTYKGLLPWGVIDHTGTWTDNVLPNNGAAEQLWWWPFTLSEVMNRNLLDTQSGSPTFGLVTNLSPVFKDKDTILGFDFRWVSHYTCNRRLMYEVSNSTGGDPRFSVAARDFTQRKITSVKNSTSIFVIWDAPQIADWVYNAYPASESIDAWGWDNNGLVYDRAGSVIALDRAIEPGQLGNSGITKGQTNQKNYNYDPPTAFGGDGWTSHLRFRHMNNTTLAALCLDGHVETRRIGEVLRRDIYTNSR